MAQGCINALQLFKEVAAQGFKGGYATVWRIVRRSALQSRSVNTEHLPVRLRQSPAEVPTVFEIIQWLMGKKHALTINQTTLLQDWVESSSAIKAGRDLAIQFTEILTKRQPDRLDEWIAKAAASSVTPLKQFAKWPTVCHSFWLQNFPHVTMTFVIGLMGMMTLFAIVITVLQGQAVITVLKAATVSIYVCITSISGVVLARRRKSDAITATLNANFLL